MVVASSRAFSTTWQIWRRTGLLMSAYCFSPHIGLIHFQGAYVVITGASEGIGKGLAIVAATKGFNLVLVSRSLEKLRHTADEIQQIANRKDLHILTIPVDCSREGPEAVVQACANLDVGVLINNVGVTTPAPTELSDHTAEQVNHIIRVNCDFTTQITREFIPILKRRKRAAIVNVSSFLSVLPASHYAVYAASKGFVNQFSAALACELAPYGIDVTLARPAHVVSSMSGISQSSLFVPDALSHARALWAKVGKANVIPAYFPHAIQEGLASCFPESWVSGALRKEMVSAREAWLAKSK
eukprot:c8116_g1_i1.p1 GENE.c8116_g1_i1~~c8116_g1_i1.p1  ORF type:complete len:300 (-),score=53.37 c8116_g1_i1:190-1089(-)